MLQDAESKIIIITVKELFLKALESGDSLGKLIDVYFIPQEIEKKQNAEVSTPWKLRQEMLNQLPSEFWKSPKKVFEPCAGKGGFLLDILEKFMNGLKDLISDEQERRAFILENCIYWADINPVNIFICNLLLNPKEVLKLNFYEGDTLKLDLQKQWGLESFDAVIGNPPYNSNLYKKFTEFCLKQTELLVFVIPSTFTIGVSHAKFISFLKDNGIKSIKFLSKDVWNVQIDIETLYLYCDKFYNGDMIINGILVDRNEKLLNVDEKKYSLFKKINSHEFLTLMKGKNKTLNYKNKSETDNIKFTQSNSHRHKLLSRLNGGKGDEIYYVNLFQEEPIKGSKVIFPRGTASYNSINNLKKINKEVVYSKILHEDILLSTGLVYILCEKEEAIFMQWYLMKSKLVRFIFITQNKFSELTKGFVNLIPRIDYKQVSATDVSIYEYMDLTPEEISLIEETIE